MATCSRDTLLTQACASGFLCLDPNIARAIELQLLKQISGSTATRDELIAQACASGFSCIGETPILARAIELQLLCNISGG